MKRFLFTLLIVSFFVGCTKDQHIEYALEKENTENVPVTRIVNGSGEKGTMTVLGKKMNNPYSVSNMNALQSSIGLPEI